MKVIPTAETHFGTLLLLNTTSLMSHIASLLNPSLEEVPQHHYMMHPGPLIEEAAPAGLGELGERPRERPRRRPAYGDLAVAPAEPHANLVMQLQTASITGFGGDDQKNQSFTDRALDMWPVIQTYCRPNRMKDFH